MPLNRINSCNIETLLDAEYKDAILSIDLSLGLNENAKLILSLSDPQGNEVKLDRNRFNLSSTDKNKILKCFDANPVTWDAEHPNLNKMKLIFSSDYFMRH